jgi:HEAT repeat protein
MLPELHEILTDLARTVQTFGMYPSGHPTRASTCARLAERLGAFLSEFGVLDLSIQRDRLVVEGEETDTDNVLLLGLAGRLYEHQLFVVRIDPEIEEQELSEFFDAISVSVGRTGDPVGAESPESLERWPHIALEPVPYSALSFSRGSADGTSEEVTDTFGGLGSRGGSGAGVSTEESLLATGGMQSAREEAARLRKDAGETEVAGSGRVREQISQLLLKLNPQARRQLHQIFKSILQSTTVDGSGSSSITDMAAGLGDGDADGSVAAALRFMETLEAQAGGEIGGSEIGTTEILRELVGQLEGESDVEGGEGGEADGALSGITPALPSPSARAIWVGPAEPRRTVQMSVEVDECTSVTEASVKKLLAAGEFDDLLNLLEDAPSGNRAADAMWDWLAETRTIKQLLESDPPDFASLDRLLPRVGTAAARSMIDALVESESRTTRMELIERLVKLGGEVGPLIVPKLTDDRWYVRRNMLTILNQLPELPEDFSIVPFLEDSDPKVRRQAMELGLVGGVERWQVIAAALRDPDNENLIFGLNEAAHGCPSDVVPMVTKLIFDSATPLKIRTQALRAVGTSDSTKALDALLRLTWERKAFIFRGLAPKSSEMLEALGSIAESWGDHPKAKELMAAARKSKDPQTRTIADRSRKMEPERTEVAE